MTKPPPDSYLRKFNERVYQHIHEQNVKKFLTKEMGDGQDCRLKQNYFE